MDTRYSYVGGQVEPLELDWDDEDEPTIEHVYTDLELFAAKPENDT